MIDAKEHQPAGIHLLIELEAARGLDDPNWVDAALRAAAKAAGATLLEVRLHHFGQGGGVTGAALLAESHITIHTWPEHQFIAADIFVCGGCSAAAAVPVLAERFGARRVQVKEVERRMEEKAE